MIKESTLLGTALPVVLVLQANPQVAPEQQTENKSAATFDYKICEEMNIDTSSEYTSSSVFEFLSSTDPSEPSLSEREVKKRTDPVLLDPIPGPEVQLDEVRNLWGSTLLKNSSVNLILSVKYKADIGKCKIAKHPVELEPVAVPHREGARRMSPEKTERANREVRDLLALGMIQPSSSPWASGIVMVKKKTGELPPSERSHHPNCLSSTSDGRKLDTWVKQRIIPVSILHGPSGKSLCEKQIDRRLPSRVS